MSQALPQRVADIMIRDVLTLRLDQSLHDGNEAMREHKIRHLPVLDAQDRLVGMLNQKVVLREALQITNVYGSNRLSHHLALIPVEEVLSGEVLTLTPESPLAEAGRTLLDNRHGAMPVVDGDGRLVGIVSSVDFVHLAVRLLEAGPA